MSYEVLFLVGRIIAGLYFFISGFMHFKYHKHMTDYVASLKIPMPAFSNVIAGLFMLLGGLTLLLGVYTKIGIWLIIAFLFIAAFKVHNFWTLKPEDRMTQMSNFMRNMGLIGLLLIVLSIPEPWIYSLNIFG